MTRRSPFLHNMTPYYFDYNATTPLLDEGFSAMEPFLKQNFGNPSSAHQLGQAPARALRQAHRQVASFLGAAEDEIFFTSGGTESNNAAIRSALAVTNKKEIVTSAVEHSSVLKLCRELAKEGCTVHEIGVDRQGQLDLEALKKTLSEKTAVVSLMMANNETGVLFPLEAIGHMLRGKNILFHTDAVQAMGKVNLSLKNLPFDFVSLSAHKFYGPKGAGALYVRKGVAFRPLIFGGNQERGRRAGTENVAGIVGLGAVCELIRKELRDEIERLRHLRDEFESRISSEISGVSINGKPSPRLPNTSSIRFEGLEAEVLLTALDQEGIYVSMGSACMSGANDPSHVLKAMGMSDDEARSCLRFSFGRGTREADVDYLISNLKKIVSRIRSLSCR